MIRCHDGTVTVRASAPIRREDRAPRFTVDRGIKTTDRDEPAEAWVVSCSTCSRPLAHVEGPREEVFADL